jgi:ribosomal protein L44E
MVQYCIEDMNRLAINRNGTCILLKYINMRTPLTWECEECHRWDAKSNEVRNGTWCPYCSNYILLTIEDMKAHAAERKGKCHSVDYHHSNIPLT